MKLKHSYSDVTKIDGIDCARDADCSAYGKDRVSFANYVPDQMDFPQHQLNNVWIHENPADFNTTTLTFF